MFAFNLNLNNNLLLNTKKIIGFGSSARSQTYLNFCGIDFNTISAIIDNNPYKQSLYSPGSSIPVISFEKGMSMSPDIIIILAWNFKNEIINLLKCKKKERLDVNFYNNLLEHEEDSNEFNLDIC